MDETARRALTRVEHLSATLLDEVAARNADDDVHSTLWPTVGAVDGHVAAVYDWVTRILRTGTPAEFHASLRDVGVVLQDVLGAIGQGR